MVSPTKIFLMTFSGAPAVMGRSRRIYPRAHPASKYPGGLARSAKNPKTVGALTFLLLLRNLTAGMHVRTIAQKLQSPPNIGTREIISHNVETPKGLITGEFVVAAHGTRQTDDEVGGTTPKPKRLTKKPRGNVRRQE